MRGRLSERIAPLWGLLRPSLVDLCREDIQAGHGKICALMGGQPSDVGYCWGFLGSRIYIRSRVRPGGPAAQWLRIPESIDGVEQIDGVLICQPAKKVKSTRDGRILRHSRRVAVEPVPWAIRKLDDVGFTVERAQVLSTGSLRGRRRGMMITVGRTVISVRGHVRNGNYSRWRFAEAMVNGVGPGRGYGLGMMISEFQP